MPAPLGAPGARTEFTHLHVASSFSLRYGTATPRALAARAADLGMPALALTDRDGLYGAFKHVQACADVGIKALLGADLALLPAGRTLVSPERSLLPERTLAPAEWSLVPSERSLLSPERPERTPAGRAASANRRGAQPGPPARVTLLAAGRAGWASLCRLVSAAHAWTAATAATATGRDRELRAADDDVPAVTQELIAEYADGLVVLLGPSSDVGQAVAARRQDLARQRLGRWRHLGVTAVVEIVDHLDHKSTFRAARMAELARDTRTPVALTNAVRYLDPVDSLAAQVLDAARHLVPLGSPRLVPHNGRAYLAGPDDMAAVASRVAKAMTGPGTASAATLLLGETAELAGRCVLDPARDLGVGAHHLPEIMGSAHDQYQELRDKCEHAILHGQYRTARAGGRPRGISRIRAAHNARDRLEHELDIIAKTGMAGYFLTVADVADRIRQAGIRCAIRGSGAGSFVNHLLGISAIDPLEHDLLMERFLSPIRNTLPDIDLDVESARRLDAYRIIFDRYGKERTACVCMMETYRARSAIRDVAAAMSLPPDEIGAIAKAFPHIRAKHITAALGELPELRRSRLNDSQLATLFQIAQQLDGLPRHVAMHPCGVLLSDKTLLNRTAVQESAEGFPLSQLDKDDAEIAGVIKLDVLGVRMQSAMAHTLTEIKRAESKQVDIDAIARDDKPVYAMIQRSETIGCFQIESPGQRELVKKLAPRDVGDLIVDISLFRPGPVNSDMIGPFLRARHGLAEPRYPHEKLEKALRETGGVVVFHEQVLRIIDVMTGCGLAEADLVRRHLSTEGGPERTAPWFRAQSLARGFDPVTVERVWQVVAAFGGFGFCKAHAAAFAIPVYQSAWLKHHYPAAFFAGVLTHDPGMYPKRVIVADARLSGVQVLPVDVNSSAADWTVVSPADPALPGGTPDPGGPYPPGYLTPNPSSRTASADATARPQSLEAPPARGRLETSGPLQALRGYLPGGRPTASPLAERPMAKSAIVSGAQQAIHPGGRPPVPPAERPMAKSAIVSGAQQAIHPGGRPPESLPDGKPRASRAGGPRRPAEAIRCSLREVKGISDAEIARIVSGQPFASLRDFWNRARVSRPVAERLVLIGAFDSLYAAPAMAPPATETVTPPAAAMTLPAAGHYPGDVPNLQLPPRPRNAGVLPPRPPDAPHQEAPAPPRPTRRDLLARVGVLARQSPSTRQGPVTLDLFTSAGAGAVDAELADGMADLVPAGELRELDPEERVAAELEILGFDVSQHVLTFYDALLAGLGVVRSAQLADRENGETILVAGAKVATQTPAVRSGQRIIFASLDDAAGLVDLAFFESVQDRCAARVFGSWLLLVRGRVRRAGAGPMAVTVNATECWDLPALEEIRIASGMTAVRAAMAAGDVGPGAHRAAPAPDPAQATRPGSRSAARPGQSGRGNAGSAGHAGDSSAEWTSDGSGWTDDSSAGHAGSRSAGHADSRSAGHPGRPVPVPAAQAADATADGTPGALARPVIFGNGFVLSPYAETGGPGGSIKRPPRTLWHASPGSTATPDLHACPLPQTAAPSAFA